MGIFSRFSGGASSERRQATMEHFTHFGSTPKGGTGHAVQTLLAWAGMNTADVE